MNIRACKLMVDAMENPHEYEGKRYKVVEGSYLWFGADNRDECIIVNGRLTEKNRHSTFSVYADTVLEEIKPEPKHVPFMEAVKAYSEGKTIRCEVVPSTTNQVYEYKPDGNKIGLHGYKLSTYKGSGTPVTTKEILEGKWFIEA